MQRYIVSSINICELHLTLVQIALLEWSDAVHDLITVSIHTYERTPQMVSELVLRLINRI